MTLTNEERERLAYITGAPDAALLGELVDAEEEVAEKADGNIETLERQVDSMHLAHSSLVADLDKLKVTTDTHATALRAELAEAAATLAARNEMILALQTSSATAATSYAASVTFASEGRSSALRTISRIHVVMRAQDDVIGTLERSNAALRRTTYFLGAVCAIDLVFLLAARFW